MTRIGRAGKLTPKLGLSSRMRDAAFSTLNPLLCGTHFHHRSLYLTILLGPQLNVLGFGFGFSANRLRHPILFVPRRTTLMIYGHPTLQSERMDLSASLYHGYMGRKRAALSTPGRHVPYTRAFVTSSEGATFLFFFFPCLTRGVTRRENASAMNQLCGCTPQIWLRIN
ncbi:hypothetical protein BGW80DRAFT_837246 [Lactifluus volemus]|nr:hypothetical protein BGW80DRAFT_837246 [Lactifluus volemus]